MRIEFFLPMAKVPTVTHQEQAVRVVKGKPVFYNPEELKAVRVMFDGLLAQHRPERPMQGAVRLLVKWLFPCGRSHQDGEYKITRPDTDNLQKLLKDCMTKCGFWKDDAQVASEICEKFWARVSGLYICAEEIGKMAPKRGKPAVCQTCVWYDEIDRMCVNYPSENSGSPREPGETCLHWEE